MKTEKVEVKGMEDVNIKMLESQLKNKEDNLAEIRKRIPRTEKTLELLKAINEIDIQVGEIIYEKITPLKFSFEYQKDEKFNELMKEKQKLMNESQKITRQTEIDKSEQEVKRLYDDEKIYVAQVEGVKEDLKKAKGE